MQQKDTPSVNGSATVYRNARDQMIAFCSTINGQPYFFQRYSIYQPSINNNGKFNQSPTPSSQHPSLDWKNVTRNQQLYAYLQSLASAPVPGWGTRITDKFPAGPVCNQILTEMVDMIRSGVNTYSIDQALTPSYYYSPSRTPSAAPGETSVVSLVPTAFDPSVKGAGASPVGTKGTGRFPTVTEAALIFYATDSDSKNNPAHMRCALVLQPYTPMAGLWTYSPLIHYKITGLDQLTINGQSGVFRSELDNLVTSRCGYSSGSNHTEAFTGLYASFRRWASGGGDQNKTVPDTVAAGMDPEVNYCFVSDKIPVDVTQNNGKFAFSGTTKPITIQIYGGYGNNTGTPDPTSLVQTIQMNFPAATWPLPSYDATYCDFNKRIDGTYSYIFDTAHDTVRSVQVDPLGPTKGDLRMLTENPNVPANYYAPFPGNTSTKAPGYSDPSAALVFSMRNGDGGASGSSYHADLFSTLNSSPGNPMAARGLLGAFMSNGAAGDFDNGAYTRQDGSYCNKPDDYFGSDGSGDQYASQIVSPNRQVCSPVMFGSLPAGALNTPPQPWQTLLFCKNPAAGAAHPGFSKIHDHVFLDFFTMPVVEPYAISEPFSTAGKVNLNYQIAPFTYITRSTGVRGVMKSTRLMAIPSTATNYKNTASTTLFRFAIDRNQTLQGFDTRFTAATPKGLYNGGVGPFRSASEICDMYLVPQGALFSTMANFWSQYPLTGDNAREFPYGHIYERVTTKSNVYTIHMCVQVLRKSNRTDPSQWVEGLDNVASEYRGSSMVERYVDPSDTTLPDFASDPTKTLDAYYKFRIINSKKFTP